MGLIPGLGRSPGEGHGNLLQYSCLENPINRGIWRATVHSVAKSQTGLKQLSIHTHTEAHTYTQESQIAIFLGYISCLLTQKVFKNLFFLS